MRKLLNFLPTHFTVCLIVGIVIQFYYKLWICTFAHSFLLLFLVLITLLIFKQYKKQFLFTLSSWLLFVFVGMFAVFSQNDTNKETYYGNYSTIDSLITIKVDKVLKSNLYYHKYVGSVAKVGRQETIGSVLMNVQKDSANQPLEVGTIMLLKPDFLTIPKPLNPYQFNYKNYLVKQGIYNQVFIRNSAFIIFKSKEVSLYSVADEIRNSIEKALIKNGFKGEQLAVIKALILGQRNDISKELIQDYTRAGAIHILAVSGLHVGIILLILSAIFKPLEKLRKGKLLKIILIVLLLWFFAIIAGLSPSVVRAVTMFTAVAIGMTFQRKTLVLHSLITSMFVLLLVKPMFLFDVGFQLSYLAVFSIVTIQPKLSSFWKPRWFVVNKFWQLFTVSIAAQIGVVPISLYYFHQFPGLFMLSNLVIIPFVGIILMGGIMVIVLSVLNLLPSILATIYNGIISLMNGFVNWISLQESFLITEISFSATKLIISYCCLGLGYFFLRKNSFKRTFAFLLAILLFQLSLFYEKHQKETDNELLIFHKSRQTIVGENYSGSLRIYHDLDSLQVLQQSSIKDYKIGKKINEVKYFNYIPNAIIYKKEVILIIDNLGVYEIENIQSPIVLLTQSPKINLERLIKEIKPKQIIADGSNYKSQVVHWKLICDKNKIPFYYTGEEGAFILK